MIVGLLAVLASFALLPCAMAWADTYDANNFASPTFHVASVNGQDGWTSAPPNSSSGTGSPTGEFDQGIVATSDFYSPAPAGFGPQAFRISNAYTSGVYALQTFSARLKDAAGESQPNTEFIASFSFITATTAYQPGLYLSISADNGVGGRVSYIKLIDTTEGIAVSFQDTPELDGAFVSYPLAVLARGVPHTIRLWIKFNSGPDNDLVRVDIDGRPTGQCYTTWENYLRANPDGSTGGVVPVTNSLQFRESSPTGGVPGVLGKGFLFGNVTLTSDNGAGPPNCDVPIDKIPTTRTVSPGGLASYTITVHNRGRMTARNYLVCDRIPRHTTFVSADRRLRRVGRKRCLFIPSLGPGKSTSVHLTLRVNANAPPGNLDNVADVTPEPPANVPASPPAQVASDLPPGATVAPVVPPINKVQAIVKVIAKKTAAPPPPVTG
jgi:uncharacterized repeat protein (TIGR01451 family)